jgi:hypothetical protein
MDTTILIYYSGRRVTTHARCANVMPPAPDDSWSICASIPQAHDFSEAKAGCFGGEHFR